jgi:hypothetical protein
MKKLPFIATFLMLTSIAATSHALSRSGRIVTLNFANTRLSTARMYVALENVSDMCGNGTMWAYYDPTDANSSEVYKILEAAMLGGKTVTFTLTKNTSTCRIEGVSVDD